MSVTVKWDRKELKTLEEDAHDFVVQLAYGVETEAKHLVPKKTGRLADSIHVDRTGVGASVVASERYAIYIEAGTRNTLPQPFLRPAMDSVLGRDR